VSLDWGAAAPPRVNGELAFTAPWERRLFGLTMALIDAGRLEREAFRQALIAAVGAWDAAGRDEAEWSYWRCWAEALEAQLEGSGALDPAALAARADALAARPAGHDHDHDHR